jgi:MFS family permease
MLTIYTCDRHKDFIKQGIIYSLIILPIPALLAFFYQVNMFLALGLSIVFIVIANGIKTIVLSIMSFRMRKFINAGAYSAISNAVASISAGVTPTIIGRIIDVSGWAAAYWVTFGLVAVIIIGLVAVDIYVRREYRKTHNLKNSDKI